MKKKGKWAGGPVGFANLICDIEKNPPSLKLKYTLPIGKGISTDTNSALIRPFKKILRDGKNPGKLTYVFLRDGSDYFVLGSFSYTGKHLIFFPGLIDRRLVNFGPTNYLKEGVTLHIDHFTLEQNFEKWHLTVDEKENNAIRFPNQKTRKLDEHNRLWFVFKIKSPNKLERCPKEFRIHLYESPNEIERRLPIIFNSRQDAIFQIVELDEKQQKPFFWYVEFFNNKSKNRNNMPEKVVIVMKNKATKVIDTPKKLPMRIHQIFLKGFDGSILIRVSKVRGEISSHLIFETGDNIVPP